MNIDKNIKDRKQELLAYFRDRTTEFLSQIKSKFAETQSDKTGTLIKEHEFYNKHRDKSKHISTFITLFLIH